MTSEEMDKMANIYKNDGIWDKAISTYKECLKKTSKIRERDVRKKYYNELFKLYCEQANVIYKSEKDSKSYKNLVSEAEKCYEKLFKDMKYADSVNTIFTCFFMEKEPEKSLEYANRIEEKTLAVRYFELIAVNTYAKDYKLKTEHKNVAQHNTKELLRIVEFKAGVHDAMRKYNIEDKEDANIDLFIYLYSDDSLLRLLERFELVGARNISNSSLANLKRMIILRYIDVAIKYIKKIYNDPMNSEKSEGVFSYLNKPKVYLHKCFYEAEKIFSDLVKDVKIDREALLEMANLMGNLKNGIVNENALKSPRIPLSIYFTPCEKFLRTMAQKESITFEELMMEYKLDRDGLIEEEERNYCKGLQEEQHRIFERNAMIEHNKKMEKTAHDKNILLEQQIKEEKKHNKKMEDIQKAKYEELKKIKRETEWMNIKL